MLKKFGMVSVGVTAGLLAVAPMASAAEGHHDNDKSHHSGSKGDCSGGNASAENESGDTILSNLATTAVGTNIPVMSCNDVDDSFNLSIASMDTHSVP